MFCIGQCIGGTFPLFLIGSGQVIKGGLKGCEVRLLRRHVKQRLSIERLPWPSVLLLGCALSSPAGQQFIKLVRRLKGWKRTQRWKGGTTEGSGTERSGGQLDFVTLAGMSIIKFLNLNLLKVDLVQKTSFQDSNTNPKRPKEEVSE